MTATFEAVFVEPSAFMADFTEQRGFTATFEPIYNRIPSNYGLITWNGTTLTVS